MGDMAPNKKEVEAQLRGQMKDKTEEELEQMLAEAKAGQSVMVQMGSMGPTVPAETKKEQ